VGKITVGSVNHPLDPIQRRKGLEYGKEVVIDNDCWIRVM
jgi:acetyltransferase-like isoleucine patch superfamily enzyme